MNQERSLSLFSIPVIVAALGYFVDIYDLLLFFIVRIPSLSELGVAEEQMKQVGASVGNYQMTGLLIGGIVWGMMGDRKGRLSVLFGSILLYSLANIANAYVQTPDQYRWARFIAGIGLAGELGAGITLVSELIPKDKRGVATSLVAGIGLTGAVLAFFIAQEFTWRHCYLIGGGLGLLLLLLRISVFESGMFRNIQHANISKGNFFMFFTQWKRFKTYLLAILIGLPTWYVIGVLVGFSDAFGKEFGIAEKINPGKAVMYAYIAISIGDVSIGLLSQALKSRKKALYIFYGITIAGMVLFFTQEQSTANRMYAICALLGFGTGFWAVFVTMAAEHFGTNLRATAATTVPNMVRGSLPLINILFFWLQTMQSYAAAAATTGIIVMIVTLVAAFFTEETFGKDLNFIEE